MPQLASVRPGIGEHLQNVLRRSVKDFPPLVQDRSGVWMHTRHPLDVGPRPTANAVRVLTQPLGDRRMQGEASAVLTGQWRDEINDGLESDSPSQSGQRPERGALLPGFVRRNGGLRRARPPRQLGLSRSRAAAQG